MDGWTLDMTAVASSVAMLAHLQHLNLSGTLCDDNDLDLIAGGCKQLSELILRDCPLLVLASFADAPSPCLQHLTVLTSATARVSTTTVLAQSLDSRRDPVRCCCRTRSHALSCQAAHVSHRWP